MAAAPLTEIFPNRSGRALSIRLYVCWHKRIGRLAPCHEDGSIRQFCRPFGLQITKAIEGCRKRCAA